MTTWLDDYVNVREFSGTADECHQQAKRRPNGFTFAVKSTTDLPALRRLVTDFMLLHVFDEKLPSGFTDGNLGPSSVGLIARNAIVYNVIECSIMQIAGFGSIVWVGGGKACIWRAPRFSFYGQSITDAQTAEVLVSIRDSYRPAKAPVLEPNALVRAVSRRDQQPVGLVSNLT